MRQPYAPNAPYAFGGAAGIIGSRLSRLGESQNMRPLLVVLISVIMLVGGAYVVFLQLTASDIMYRFLFSGLLVSVLGLYLLWDEFLR